MWRRGVDRSPAAGVERLEFHFTLESAQGAEVRALMLTKMGEKKKPANQRIIHDTLANFTSLY